MHGVQNGLEQIAGMQREILNQTRARSVSRENPRPFSRELSNQTRTRSNSRDNARPFSRHISNPYCSKCGRNNHWTRDCRDLRFSGNRGWQASQGTGRGRSSSNRPCPNQGN